MDNRWIHPLFKPSRSYSRDTCLFVGHGNFASGALPATELNTYLQLSKSDSADCFGTIMDNGGAPRNLNNRLTVFVVAALIAIVFSVTAIFLKAKLSYGPRIAGLELSDFTLKDFSPIDKEAFLSRLSLENRRKIASQVHYVYQLISSAKLSKAEAKKLASLIVLESIRAGYDPLFVTAVIKSESTFNRHAVSYAGARGLMQIMPDTGKFVSRLNNVKWSGIHKLHDPEYNIRLGIAYLKHLEDSFDGDRELMLIAYNWGPQNVIDSLRNLKRIPTSCLTYAKTIINNHGEWNQHYSENMAQFKYMDVEFLS